MGKPDEEAMKRAFECYRNENISIRDAATRYGVKKIDINRSIKW